MEVKIDWKTASRKIRAGQKIRILLLQWDIKAKIRSTYSQNGFFCIALQDPKGRKHSSDGPRTPYPHETLFINTEKQNVFERSEGELYLQITEAESATIKL